MDLRLIVVHGKPPGKEIPIQALPFLIGRGPECQLRPNSDMVSRRHCAFTSHGQEVCIRDLGSTNGTIVNGERLDGELALNDGDIVQVGLLAFQVVIRPGVAMAQAPSSKAGEAIADPAVVSNSADADDVVQWLIGDSKSGIPTSGSGVYDGKTVFSTSPVEGKSASASDPSTSAAGPSGGGEPSAAKEPHGDRKAAEPKQKPLEQAGKAAHAAENAIRKFLERRPRG